VGKCESRAVLNLIFPPAHFPACGHDDDVFMKTFSSMYIRVHPWLNLYVLEKDSACFSIEVKADGI
jgi:hypothetical protein